MSNLETTLSSARANERAAFLSRLMGNRRIFDLSHLTGDGDALWRRLQQTYAEQIQGFVPAQLDGSIKQADFCLLHDFSLNAVTNLAHQTAAIGITVGAPVFLHDLFCGLLSHPGVLKDIGAAHEEQQRFKSFEIPQSIDPFKPLHDPEYVVAPRFMPLGKARRAYAELMTHIALDFLFLHEVCHLLAGHLPYRRAKLSCHTEITAFGEAAVATAADALTHHAIEMDADWFAMRLLVPLCLKDEIVLTDLRPINESAEFRFRLIALAIILSLLLGDRNPPPLDECLRAREHPHPVWRVLMLEPIAIQAIGHNDLKLEEAWRKAHRQALTDLYLMSRFLPLAHRYFALVDNVGRLLNAKLPDLYGKHQEVLRHLKEGGWDLRQQ